MKANNNNKGFESTLKSLDTEEFIDIHFYRPIGYQWALLFNKLNISPNAVTIASIFIGIASGVCFYFDDVKINVVGMLLLIWANSYDSADGQLARMTGKKSELGRILDGTCGDLWFISIYAAICLRLTPDWGISIWILAAATGFFHSKQAAMADYYRNIHLLFLKGESGSELSKSNKLKNDYYQLSWRKEFIYKLFSFFYLNYTKRQEKNTPQFQEMMKSVEDVYKGIIPNSFRQAFRTKSLPLMKYTNMLSFNTRVIALFASLFIDMPWLYFVFEITILNMMLIYMVRTHEKFCEIFRIEILKEK
ncbi:MAG: CDP-alcohol phosphatidyltransferase family protein [Massilibacteroides sp.]|nr:CDP-alcohol phosphatidyltransferase family protein [Massilibacteroides sp.]MDD3064260.1 CDP-alcohol phosphatidyltransferase family protein [Massilibacteroides sp.]MDD4114976.1 CDP-alcohol phosphatidyltransferase family protein [Massilibacteroides sp.]MDD4659910.1 CDP-alcohol phosphatidyltransferase family protein [Massilibacteroides sp.]